MTEVLFAFNIKSVWKVPTVSTEIAHLARWGWVWYVRTFGKTCQLSQRKVQVFMGTMKWCWVALKGICGVIWDRDLKAFWLKLFWTYQHGWKSGCESHESRLSCEISGMVLSCWGEKILVGQTFSPYFNSWDPCPCETQETENHRKMSFTLNL